VTGEVVELLIGPSFGLRHEAAAALAISDRSSPARGSYAMMVG
jgi:hypothetical protein